MCYNPSEDLVMLALAATLLFEGSPDDSTSTQISESTSSTQEVILPSFMIPNQEAFEKSGFIMEKLKFSHGHANVYKSTLPKGWKLRKSKQEHFIYFIDEKGRKRGYFDSDHMRLVPKYFLDWYNPFYPVTVVVRDMDNHIYLLAGECEERYTEEFNQIISKAVDWLNSNYPEWKDPTKYWD